MLETEVRDSDALCPECGCDKTLLVKEFDVDLKTGESTVMDEFRECSACSSQWDSFRTMATDESL